MQISFEKCGDKSQLGPSFNLEQWCSEWLNSSGINILTPVFDEAGKLSIKQTMSLRGKNRLRKQRLDIALYDETGAIHVIKDHLLSENEESTIVDMATVPSDFKIAAVYINHGNHAYAKIRFDEASIQWFTKNLSNVKDAGSRASIWRYFWYLVMDVQMTSLKYAEFVVNNLPNEPVEQTINVALMNLRTLIANYIPAAKKVEHQAKIFKILLELLQKSDDSIPKTAIVDQLFSFISDSAQLEQCKQWMEAGEISFSESKIALSKSQRYTILYKLFQSSSAFTKDQKVEMMEKLMSGDKTDVAVNHRHMCMAALPEAEVKAQVWAEIIDVNSKNSIYV